MAETKEYVTGIRQLRQTDFWLEEEVLLEEETANCYLVISNCREIFEITLDAEEYLNVYVDYDLRKRELKAELELSLHGGRKDRQLYYKLSEEERAIVQRKTEEYLWREGILLPRSLTFTVEIEDGIYIGNENGSGCRYTDVWTADDLGDKVKEFLWGYVQEEYNF